MGLPHHRRRITDSSARRLVVNSTGRKKPCPRKAKRSTLSWQDPTVEGRGCDLRGIQNSSAPGASAPLRGATSRLRRSEVQRSHWKALNLVPPNNHKSPEPSFGARSALGLAQRRTSDGPDIARLSDWCDVGGEWEPKRLRSFHRTGSLKATGVGCRADPREFEDWEHPDTRGMHVKRKH